MTDSHSVILLHDQLLDARIWIELRPLVASFAAVTTVSPPPLHILAPPAVWADHVARSARDAIAPGAVDLAVTVGGAGEAGIALVAEGLARAALLVDPDITPFADESTSRLLHEPEVAGRLEAFFDAVDSHSDVLRTSGTLSEQGVEAFVDATFADTGDLTEPRRELLRQIMRDQLTAALPLDLAAQQVVPADRPDWIARLVPFADRCTIATSLDHGLNARVDLKAALRRRVPGVAVVDLTNSTSYLLSHPPDEIAGVIHDLLRGRRPRTEQ